MRSTRFVFAAACLGMLLFGIGLITLGSVATGLQQTFHLDSISSGSLFSILPIGIIAGSLLFGPFSDRYGYKPFLLLSCFSMFAGFEGIAYAPSLNVLKGCIFLFGFGGGAINGASNAIVADISASNKGANLSLLGVFFAIGALGMPVVLGLLEKHFTYVEIVASIGYVALAAALFFIVVAFPAPKQSAGVPFSQGLKLLQDGTLLLIAFFLFCQSAFEAVINNWTTTYLPARLAVPESKALYALSFYVVGMAIMRLILGSVLRRISSRNILLFSMALLFVGCALLRFSTTYLVSVGGMITIGAGLAAGYPVMLGMVGSRYAALSGTAFSIVISIALAGNMIISYLMGIIAEAYGIAQLPTVVFVLSVLMLLLTIIILPKKST